MSDAPAPTVAHVNQVSALADPLIRNLQITQCYHELAARLAERTGPSANWCTFATWASKQAGVTIRKEDLVRALEGRRQAAFATAEAAQGVALSAQAVGAGRDGEALQQLVWEAWDPLKAFDRTSAAVARGNLKVFEEIGREFARFVADCVDDAAFDADRIAGFCDALRPGEPPEGQRYLRQAFTRYYQALFEFDPKVRAELLLLANIEVGLHEQTRLQPEILEALNAPFIEPGEFKRRLAAALLRQGDWRALARWLVMRLLSRLTPLDAAVDAFVAALQRQARLITSEVLMMIELPHGKRLRLGEDLSAPYPPSLQQLENPELCALLARVDPTPDSTRDTGAVDWGDLPDRLHFILDMFRCFQEASDLFEPPFTAEQVAELKAGRRPDGRL